MRRVMAGMGGLAVVLAVTVWTGGSAGIHARGSAVSEQGATSPVERGEYLVTAMGCNDCHTPMKMGANGPEPDMARMLSGHPGGALPPPPPPAGPWIAAVSATFTGWAGPWGVSYTRNITPDNDTGIGTWTEQQFVDTIRNGRQQGRGRELLPPMPWPMIRHLTDDDLKAIFAYLRSIPAISNQVPDPVIAAPPTP